MSPTITLAGLRSRGLAALSTAAALAFTPWTSTHAQRAPTGSTPRSKSAFCFRGAPIDRCHTFLIVETELTGRTLGVGPHLFSDAPPILTAQGDTVALGDARPTRINGYFAVNLGLMVNRPRGDAIGGLFQIANDNEDNERLALMARRRLWLSRAVAVDVDLGGLRLKGERLGTEPETRSAYGLTTGGAIDYADLLSVTAHLDMAAGHEPQLALIAGARSGSYVSLVVLAAGALVAAAFAHSNFD